MKDKGMIQLAQNTSPTDSLIVLYIDDYLSSSMVKKGVHLMIRDKFPEAFIVKKIIKRRVEKRSDNKYGEYVTIEINSIKNWHPINVSLDKFDKV